jgi:SAM-dependent methyltransferase
MEPWRERLIEMVGRRGPSRVLEAGGATKTRVPLPDAHYTVVDISTEALARTDYAQELLLGDLQTFEYGARRFDLAVFWDVLEHLRDPAPAIARACDALEPGGAIVIKGPLLRSTKGLVTRLTPHWFHVAYYRAVLQKPEAGTPGNLPFRTEHASDADPTRLSRLLREHGLQVRHYESFALVHGLEERFPLVYRLYMAIGGLLHRLSAGRYGGHETDFVMLAVKAPLSGVDESDTARPERLRLDADVGA